MSTACSSALHKAALAVFYEATRTQQAQAEARRRAQIKRAQAAFADLFRRQGRLMLERLPRLAKFFLTEAAYDGDLVDAFSEVFGTTRRQAEKALVDSLFDGLSLGYTTQATEFGIEQSFKIGSKRAMDWARANAAAKVTAIDETTRESIQGVITRGIESGESYGSVAREIRDRFDGFSTQRAETIAVTENAYSYEQGARSLVDDIEAVGIKMEKQWSTIGGDACEEICAPNEAQGWIPADDDFQSGDAQPPGHPNCRCTCLYQVAEEPGKEQPERIELPSEEVPTPEEVPTAPEEQPVPEERPDLDYSRVTDTYGLSDLPDDVQSSALGGVDDVLAPRGVRVDSITTKETDEVWHARTLISKDKTAIEFNSDFVKRANDLAAQQASDFASYKSNEIGRLKALIADPAEGYAIADNEIRLARMQSTQRWSIATDATNPLRATAQHEAYHVLDADGALSSAFRRELYKEAGGSTGADSLLARVSEYARSMPEEAFAEVGTAISSGVSIPKEVARAFARVVK